MKPTNAKWTYEALDSRKESFGVKDRFNREVGINVSVCRIEQESREGYEKGFGWAVKFDGASEFYCTIIQPTRNGEIYQKDNQSYFATLEEAFTHASKSIEASRKRAFKKFSV